MGTAQNGLLLCSASSVPAPIPTFFLLLSFNVQSLPHYRYYPTVALSFVLGILWWVWVQSCLGLLRTFATFAAFAVRTLTSPQPRQTGIYL